MLFRPIVVIALLFNIPSFLIAQNNLHRADSLLVAKKYKEALVIYNNELEKTPGSCDLMLKIAKVNVESINYTDALLTYEQAIKTDPKCHEAYFRRGLLYNKLRFLKEAHADLNAAIAIKDAGEYYFWRGVLSQQIGDMQKAEADYGSAINKKHSAPELHNNYGIILCESGKYAEALKNLNRAVALDPHYPEAISARGKVYLFLLNVDSACIEADRAYEMGYSGGLNIPSKICKGNKLEKLQYAAEILGNSKSYPKAIEAYSKLIALCPDSSVYYVRRGDMKYSSEDWKGAISDFSQAIVLSPQNYYPYYMRGASKERSEELKGALDDFTQAIKLNPASEWAVNDRGLINNKLKNYKDAEMDFRRALELKSNWTLALFNLGLNYSDQGDHINATEYYNKAIKADPNNYRAFNNLGHIYFKEKKYDLAIAHYDQAMSIFPKYSHALTNRAAAKYAKGNKKEACEDLHLAMEYGEKDILERINEYCAPGK
jgi:tetratricopeptide (TPR) repeat protein